MAQLLLPTLPNLDLPYRGVRAELYKLNIYSGPSGKFLSHVDTPRASTQFGSLVVCLSVEHEGGGLVVRHKGRSMTFNWSASNQGISTAPGIKWAAFYSDVEHEVLEVTSGHRVTLMYNLYVSQDSGMLNGICPNLSSQRIPLHGIFREAFMEPTFFPKGGRLGILCSHAYAHHSNGAHKLLPQSLKGIDMALYTTLRGLRLDVHLRPVLDKELGDLSVSGPEDDPEEVPEYTSKEEAQRAWEERAGQAIVRREIAPMRELDGDLMGSHNEVLSEGWEHDRVKVTWLDWLDRRHRECAVTFIAYGNQASLGCFYSSLGILAYIPPYAKRTALMVTK